MAGSFRGRAIGALGSSSFLTIYFSIRLDSSSEWGQRPCALQWPALQLSCLVGMIDDG